MKIAFWKKSSLNMMSHGKGLTADEVKALQTLKVGDRLILWNNDVKSDKDPNITLKVYQPAAQTPTRAI